MASLARELDLILCAIIIFLMIFIEKINEILFFFVPTYPIPTSGPPEHQLINLQWPNMTVLNPTVRCRRVSGSEGGGSQPDAADC